MSKDSQLDPKPIRKIKAKGGPTMAESALDGGTNNNKKQSGNRHRPGDDKAQRRLFMGTKSTKHKKEDGKFDSKNIKHDPAAESARAVFGLKKQDAESKERK